MIRYQLSSLAENEKHLENYLNGITIPYDDFLEDHILNSAIFHILSEGEHIGFFGKLENMATIFFVQDEHIHQARDIFTDIKTQFNIQQAFVPTTDAFFLSVALEQFTKMDIQALHFMESNRVVRPPEFPSDRFRLAVDADLKAIEAMAGDFLDQYPERIRTRQIYVLEDNHEMIGLGVLVENKLMRNCAGTGMFTKEAHRGKGVGRSILFHLKEIVHEMGKRPIPGCGYYNVHSRKTLESTGYISKSKLLKFQF